MHKYDQLGLNGKKYFPDIHVKLRLISFNFVNIGSNKWHNLGK